MKLHDDSLMPLGKYKGQPMSKVPVEYLHWYWHNCKPHFERELAIMDYIEENLSALKTENDDLIWTKHQR